METHRLALPKGFRLANYELTRVLGKGGFGITYLGLDRHLGRKVAVKELMPDSIVTRIEGMLVVPQSDLLSANWTWAKERFLEEARTLASFKHPNIVEVHQLIESNGTVYMVMDYIEGESYEARLRRITIEPDENSMRLLLEPLLDGLEEVHNAGLLHRDIKPDNILLRRGVQPILLDFGSSRKLLEGTAVMTSLVTHGYSPIEQYQVKGKQGAWTDIYALGAVAVRAITGEKPPMSADRVSEDDFVWLSYRNLKGYSPLFLQAVDWALRVKPKDRPQAVKEWRASFGWDAKPSYKSKPSDTTLLLSGEKTALAIGSDLKAAPSPLESSEPTRPKTEPSPPAPRVYEKSKIVTSHTTTTSQVTTSVAKKLKTSWKSPQIIVIVILVIFGATFTEWLMHRQASQRPVVNASTDAMPSATSSTPIPRAHYTPFVNSLGMKFAPVHGTDVLFSIWDTRVGDYKAFVDATGRAWRPPDFMQTSDHPAVNVSWEDANAFCEWLSKKEGRIYRLPTDAEWSVAVGLESEIGAFPSEKDGKIKNVYPWVGAWPPPKGAGNYAHSVLSDDFEKTSPVGSFTENRYGLFDMSGNVWQWCEDWYDRAHHKRVLRGGAWNSCLSTMLLCSFRYYSLPDDQCDNVGFRCVTPAKDTEKQ